MIIKKNSVVFVVALLLFGQFFVGDFIKEVKASPQNHYVRAGANGDNSGSDWENALTAFPSAFVRGDTYYIADGEYVGNYVFNTPESNTAYVNIKKATVGAHGNNQGWNNSYGDGKAIFKGSISVENGYLDFDGVVGGGPANWTGGHGFEFTGSAGSDISYFNISGGVSNVRLHHIYFNQTGNTEIYTRGANAIYNATTLNDSLFEYLYFDNLGGLPFFFRSGTGNIIQYNYSGNICGMSAADMNQHCEALVLWGMSNLQFRWNYISESPSSGAFVKNSSPTADLIRIYGNYFQDGNAIVCNTGACTNWRVFNNTINNGYGPVSGDGNISGAYVYNNIVYNSDAIKLWPTHDYNWFSNSGLQCDMQSGAHENISTNFPNDCDALLENKNPFVNSSGNAPETFKIYSPLAGFPGINVCVLDDCTGEDKFNLDAFGNTRGADGVWDIGAYEYSIASDVPAPPIIEPVPPTTPEATSSSPVVPPDNVPASPNSSSTPTAEPVASSPGTSGNTSSGGSSGNSSSSGSSSGSSNSSSSGSSSSGSLENVGNTFPLSQVPSAGSLENSPGNNSNNQAKLPDRVSLINVPSAQVEVITKNESSRMIETAKFTQLSEVSKKIYGKIIVLAGKPLVNSSKYVIAGFINNGTPSTVIVGAGERGGAIASFRAAFGRLPEEELDWQDVIKIANGRWPTQRNSVVENQAKIKFKKIYRRTPDTKNAKDNAVIIIMAYGLLPAQRNINNERAAIASFKSIYKKAPITAEEWNIVRAIAYSGARR